MSDADFRGRYMLIYFGYSYCPDVCPTTLAVMADALEKLGGKARRVVPIFITVDPERDTPKVLADYMQAFGPDFIGLTGSEAAIKDAREEIPRLCREAAAGPCQGTGGRLWRGPFHRFCI